MLGVSQILKVWRVLPTHDFNRLQQCGFLRKAMEGRHARPRACATTYMLNIAEPRWMCKTSFALISCVQKPVHRNCLGPPLTDTCHTGILCASRQAASFSLSPIHLDTWVNQKGQVCRNPIIYIVRAHKQSMNPAEVSHCGCLRQGLGLHHIIIKSLRKHLDSLRSCPDIVCFS